MRPSTVILCLIFLISLSFCQNSMDNPNPNGIPIDKTIFVYGGGIDQVFLRYVISLTKKENPNICYIPTASADNAFAINYWDTLCSNLSIKPYILRTFINSSKEQKSFEEQILSYDAIIVGGGNTLNMLAIWKAQGIDIALKKAYNKGIILAGGSAGSLCWFKGGYTDSRPKELTILRGLGFLDYSHSPHYNSEPARRTLYHKAVLTGKLQPGYACDDQAGLLFINGKMVKAVTHNSKNKNYFVSKKNREIIEEIIPSEIIK